MSYREAVLKMVSLLATTRDVGESLSSQYQLEKIETCLCFMKIVSSIRFLGRQGLSLRWEKRNTGFQLSSAVETLS